MTTTTAGFRFWLGTHAPPWLARPDVAVPLFVSHATLRQRRRLPAAVTEWACDSGAFSELAAHGADAFPDGPPAYAAAVRRYRDEIGRLAWAAPQDWMCEPFMLARTGLTVAEHQRRTVANYLDLRTLAPDLPIRPVLQGNTPADYEHCARLYQRAGVDLAAEPLVGLGSVCRRQHTGGIAGLAADLAGSGIRLHAFGAKTTGLPVLAAHLASADSLAWSYVARRQPVRLPGCQHANCANCPRWALTWRTRLLTRIAAPQLDLFGSAA
jgi:hypothetical protein